MSLTKVSYSMISGEVINALDYGFSASATGAQNTAALQAACTAGSTGSIQTVFIPSGNYNITGTINTYGCPLMGEGSDKTVLFPTTSAPAIIVSSFNHGNFGGIGINFFNTSGSITSSAVGIDLYGATQCTFNDVLVSFGYNAFRLLSTNGAGTIFQVLFQNCISNYCKYEAFYFDSATNSTTVNFTNCHVYGITAYNPLANGWDYFRGWYLNNVSTSTFNNCSMDGGGGAGGDGTIIKINNYNYAVIDTFHSESYTQTTGGTSYSPFVFAGGGTVDFNNLYTVSYTCYVNSSTIAYIIRSSAYSTILGSFQELAPIITSGTYLPMYCSGSYIFVEDASIPTSKIYYPNSTNSTRVKQTSSMFYFPSVQQVTSGSINTSLTASNAGYTTILNVPPLSGITAQKNAGLYIVCGNNGSLGIGWTDLIVLVSAWSGTTATAVVSSNNSGAAPTRTYQYNSSTDSIQVITNSATAYNVVAYGTSVAQNWF